MGPNGLALGDLRGLKRELGRIDDVQTPGSAVFSQCHCITHGAMGGCERKVDWPIVALGRLEELAMAKHLKTMQRKPGQKRLRTPAP